MKYIKFFFKSLYQNVCILTEKQHWLFALIVLLMSLVISVSPTLSSGYTTNVSTLINSNYETAIDKGFAKLQADIDDANSIIIENGVLSSTGKFAMRTKDEVSDLTKVYEPNATYSHYDGETEVEILRVYLVDLNGASSKEDSQLLSSFVNISIYKSESATSSTPKAVQSSFLILTRDSVHLSLYKAKGGTEETAAIGSLAGNFTDKAFKNGLNFKSLRGSTDKETKDKWINFLNDSYTPIRITSTWTQVGIYTAINFGVIFFAGLIFFLFSRSKSSLQKFSFFEALKVSSFMSLTPAILSAVMTLIMPQFGVFLFLVVICFRMMSAVSRINGNSPSNNQQGPVYKARS